MIDKINSKDWAVKIKVIQFKKDAFASYDDIPFNYWHAWNPITNNEYTLCGYAFEGDGVYIDENSYVIKEGKITCPECIKLIDFCKTIKVKNISRRTR